MNWSAYNYNTTQTFTLKGLETYGRVVQIHDGDTMTIILPFANNFYKFSVRLAGIDTCEVSSKTELNKTLANMAKKRLVNLVTTTSDIDIKKYLLDNIALVYVRCLEFDKFGRVLVIVSKDKGSESFSDILIKEKLAYAYDGKKKLSEEQQIDILS